MFELGTTEHWWETAKKYPALSHQNQILKPLGYAFMINLIEQNNLNKILEVGHGAGSHLFPIFEGKREMWGLDDVIEGSGVSPESLKHTREDNPHVKFVNGLLGNDVKELPDNYFDLVCSVSVVEHIPHEVLEKVYSEIFRILKPGGIVAHSYDVYYNQNTKPMFDAIEKNNFEWLKPKETMNVFWEEWLGITDKELTARMLKRLIIENPMVVTEWFMWKTPREKRLTPPNFFSVLIAAKKPE